MICRGHIVRVIFTFGRRFFFQKFSRETIRDDATSARGFETGLPRAVLFECADEIERDVFSFPLLVPSNMSRVRHNNARSLTISSLRVIFLFFFHFLFFFSNTEFSHDRGTRCQSNYRLLFVSQPMSKPP